MNKYLYKIIAFIVIFGLLLLLGTREMKRRGINRNNISPEDVVDVYESYNIIGSVNYMEIEVPDSESNADGYTYKKAVKISDKNDISLLGIIQYLVERSDGGFLGLLYYLGYDLSLSLCTSEIRACGISYTAICCSLKSVERLISDFRNRCIASAHTLYH